MISQEVKLENSKFSTILITILKVMKDLIVIFYNKEWYLIDKKMITKLFFQHSMDLN